MTDSLAVVLNLSTSSVPIFSTESRVLGLEMAYQRAWRAARPMVDEHFSKNFGTVRSVWETPAGNS
jgi:orotate phosphoribosyltransferase-like protein